MTVMRSSSANWSSSTGAENDVGVGVRGLPDDLGCFVDLEQPQGQKPRYVEQHS
jgi:hypothetical protein